MPYGFPKKLGGDSAANDAKMERCVADLKAQGHDEVSAIRICKASLEKSAAKKTNHRAEALLKG